MLTRPAEKKLEEDQAQVYEKYERLFNETKLLEEEVMMLADEILRDDLVLLEKVFDLNYYIDIGEVIDMERVQQCDSPCKNESN